MSSLAELKVYLTQAEAAYHALMTGEQIVTVSNVDGSTSYNQVSIKRLEIYIAQLKAQIAVAGGTGSKPRSPTYFNHPA